MLIESAQHSFPHQLEETLNSIFIDSESNGQLTASIFDVFGVKTPLFYRSHPTSPLSIFNSVPFPKIWCDKYGFSKKIKFNIPKTSEATRLI